MKRLLIVDFYALFHRGRSAMKRTGRDFTTSAGIPVTGVFPFINNLLAAIKQVEPTHVVVCYDAGGNQRKSDNTEYKANRTGVSDNFKVEAGILLNEGINAMGLEVVGLRGYEADDIIYTIHHAANYGMDRMDEVIVWTCDQDLLQMVTDRTKVLLFNTAKKQVLMGTEEVVEKWGCLPEQIALVKAIAGDSSDNIKGVPRVGMKTAVKMLNEAEWSLDAVLDNPKLRGFDELIKDNLHLVTLRRSWEITGVIDFEDYKLGKGLTSVYGDFLASYEFTSLQKRLKSTMQLLQLQ